MTCRSHYDSEVPSLYAMVQKISRDCKRSHTTQAATAVAGGYHLAGDEQTPRIQIEGVRPRCFRPRPINGRPELDIYRFPKLCQGRTLLPHEIIMFSKTAHYTNTLIVRAPPPPIAHSPAPEPEFEFPRFSITISYYIMI